MAYGFILATAALAASVALYLQDPLLLNIRETGTVALCVLALLGLVQSGFYIGYRRLALSSSWALVLILVCAQAYRVDWQQQQVLTAHGAQAEKLAAIGKHLVIGYDQAGDIIELVQRGYIAGIFVTHRNVQGKTAAALRAEITMLQQFREQAGLPPLLVTTDQEGGAVSRLSPLLPYQPTLATLVAQHSDPAALEQAAYRYGVQQGRGLAELGINTNFSPVVDLKTQAQADVLDIYSRIAERAIASDPEVVRFVASAYSRGLLSQGVTPTIKHFPGLGHVAEDTHITSAYLAHSPAQLAQADWYPFRELLANTPAMLMIGHVIVDQVDPQYPASLSRPLIQGVIRQQWGYQGKIISDDMSMGAVYQYGLCHASQQALNAGVDLLLLSYDWRKVYGLLHCLAKNVD